MKIFCKHVFKLEKSEIGLGDVEYGSVILGNYCIREETIIVHKYKCLICGKEKIITQVKE